MAVNVGEIAAEVSADGPSAPSAHASRDDAKAPGADEEQWAELRRRSAWLADRVRAEGFHD